MTHASRALQSHDLSGEGINSGSHTYSFFDHTRTWRASLDEGSAQCRGHLRDDKNIKDDTHHSLIHSNKANMKGWLRLPIDIRGTIGPKVFWHLSYRWRKPPQKTSPRKLILSGDRTLARYVTGAHVTACSTAVDLLYIINHKNRENAKFEFSWGIKFRDII